MKKNLLLLASLAMMGTSVFAQKLSPNTELLLLNRNNTQMLKSFGCEESQTVGAYVKVKNEDVLAEIEKLGGAVNANLTGTLVTMTIPVDKIRTIAELDDVEYIQVGDPVKELMDEARTATNVNQCHELAATTGKYRGAGVVVGVVDNGIELGHVDYYSSDGKEYRIKRYWNQRKTGTRPTGYSYGAEYKDSARIVAQKYDLTTTYHGGHVLGIAAGADKASGYQGVAPEADIVFVTTNMTSTGVTDAVKYIFDYAESVGKPCVVNLSLGSHYGPHDGNSASDQTFASLTGPGRIIVGAAGNEGMYNIHVSKTLSAEAADSLSAIVAPYSGYYSSTSLGSAVVDGWGEVNTNISARVVLCNVLTGKVLTSSELISTTSSTSKIVTLTYNGTSYKAQIAPSVNKYSQRPNITIALQGSVTGNFRLGVVFYGDEGTTIHAWCPNDVFQFVANLNNSCVKKGWTAGNTDCTAGETGGTGKTVISVGSFNTKLSYTKLDGTTENFEPSYYGSLSGLSSFSSHGPTVDGRQKPDITAPGCAIISAQSQYCTAASYDNFSATGAAAKTTFNGKAYYYQGEVGTSMASPFVAGVVALWLQADPTLTPDKIREVFANTAVRDTYTGESPVGNDNMWGAGKVDAYAGLQYVIEHKGETSGIEDQISGTDGLYRVVTDRNSHSAKVYFAESSAPVHVAVYNALGQQVAGTDVTVSGESIDLTSLADGVYVFKLQRGGKTQSVKTAL